MDDGFADLFHVIALCSDGVFAGKFDIIRIGAREFYACHSAPKNFLFGHFQLKLAVQRAGRDKGMNTSLRCGFNRFAAGANIAVITARKRADDAIFDFGGDRLNRFEITGGGGRKASFHDVNLERLKRFGKAQLLPACHRKARRLLAVS